MSVIAPVILNHNTPRTKEMSLINERNIQMYGNRKLAFEIPVPSRLTCTLCGKIMQKPIQTLRGLVACANCYNAARECIGDAQLCPLDAELIEDAYNFTRPDKFIARDIAKLKVYCAYEEQGCKWIGALNDIEDHEDMSCEYAYTQCDICDEDVQKKDLKQHQQKCTNTKETLPSISITESKSFNFEYLDELTLEKYNKLRDNYEKLKLECNENSQALDKTKKELEESKKEVVSLKSKVEQIKNFTTEQNKYICQLKRKLIEYEKLTEGLVSLDYDAKIKELKEIQNSFKQSPVAKAENLLNVYDNTGLVKRLEEENAIFSANLADMELKVQLLEKLSTNGHQIWKIENFAYRLNQAMNKKNIALHSAPCYTSSINGYKFCVRVYPNGDGIGLNTHISVYFVLMKSHYDNLLEWPFFRKITFRLINIKDISKSKKETFITDRKSPSFQKPMKDMNIAAGCPRFLSKESLLNDGFIVDDSVYIETIVQDS